MNKQQLIEQYYGEDYARAKRSEYGIDEDGFSDFNSHHNHTFLHGYEIFQYTNHSKESDGVKVRPLGLGKALVALKNNNGWALITEEKRVPEHDFWICNPKIKGCFFHDALTRIPKKYTHYQFVERPKPILY